MKTKTITRKMKQKYGEYNGFLKCIGESFFKTYDIHHIICLYFVVLIDKNSDCG